MPLATETAWPFNPPPGCAFRLSHVDPSPPHTPTYQLICSRGSEASALAYLRVWIDRLAQNAGVQAIVNAAASAPSPGHAASQAQAAVAAARAQAPTSPGTPKARAVALAPPIGTREPSTPSPMYHPPAAAGLVPPGNAATDASPPLPSPDARCARSDCGRPLIEHEPIAPHPHLASGCGWFCVVAP